MVVFAEGIFKHESIVIYPHDDLVSNKICVELRPPKDIAIDLHVTALVGYQASSHFHVFELSRHLPRFSMYGFVRSLSLSKAEHGSVSKNTGQNDGGGRTHRNTSPVPNEFTEPTAEGTGRVHLETNRQEWDQNYSSLTNTISNESFHAEVHQPQSFVIFRINDSLGKVVCHLMNYFILEFFT